MERKSPMERLIELEILIGEMKDAVTRSERLLQKAAATLEEKPSRLPVFKGYTVDERLREFRKVLYHDEGPSIEFIPFDSPKGQELLSELVQSSDLR